MTTTESVIPLAGADASVASQITGEGGTALRHESSRKGQGRLWHYYVNEGIQPEAVRGLPEMSLTHTAHKKETVCSADKSGQS